MNDNTMLAGLRGLLAKAGLAELGPGPRAGVMPERELRGELGGMLKGGNVSEVSKELICGLVLLWHDHTEEAHEIAQAIANVDGSFLHGILHRREPDYGNATYWFRRVGRHGSFPQIASRVGELLKTNNEPRMEKELIRNGEWDPYGFIGVCEKAMAKGAVGPQMKLLREIQGIESEVLLDCWAGVRNLR